MCVGGVGGEGRCFCFVLFYSSQQMAMGHRPFRKRNKYVVLYARREINSNNFLQSCITVLHIQLSSVQPGNDYFSAVTVLFIILVK